MTDTDHSTDTPPRRSAGPKRSAASHAAILAAAEALLREHGPAGVTFEAVARRAKAGKPTLYRWWPNRIALLLELYDLHKDRVIAAPDGTSLRDDLVQLTSRLWAFWRDTPAGATFAAVIAEAQDDPDLRQSLVDHFADDARSAHNVLDLAIDRAVERGELPRDTDGRAVREAIMAVSWFHLLCGRLDEERVRPTVDRLVDGLLPRPR